MPSRDPTGSRRGSDHTSVTVDEVSSLLDPRLRAGGGAHNTVRQKLVPTTLFGLCHAWKGLKRPSRQILMLLSRMRAVYGP